MTPDVENFAVVAVPGTADYYALLFSPAGQRAGLRVLLGIEMLLVEVAEATMEEQVRHSKMLWWAEELVRFNNGNPVHPLMQALAGMENNQNLFSSALQRVYTAVAHEVTGDLPTTPPALLEHAADGGNIVAALASMLSCQRPSSAAELGTLQAVSRARYLVLRLASAHRGHSHSSIDNEQRQLLGQLGQRVSVELSESLQKLTPPTIKAWRPLLVMADFLQRALPNLEASQSVPSSTSLGRLFDAWRTARRAARGTLPAWTIPENPG